MGILDNLDITIYGDAQIISFYQVYVSGAFLSFKIGTVANFKCSMNYYFQLLILSLLKLQYICLLCFLTVVTSNNRC